MDIENVVMELVVNGGNAKSKALEAVAAAAKHDFKLADELIKECEEALNNAHKFQTDLIQKEINNGKKTEVSLIMIHGQDHLMNAITVRDLAIQMIEMYKVIYQKQ